MVVGYHHFRKHPYIFYIMFVHSHPLPVETWAKPPPFDCQIPSRDRIGIEPTSSWSKSEISRKLYQTLMALAMEAAKKPIGLICIYIYFLTHMNG